MFYSLSELGKGESATKPAKNMSASPQGKWMHRGAIDIIIIINTEISVTSFLQHLNLLRTFSYKHTQKIIDLFQNGKEERTADSKRD